MAELTDAEAAVYDRQLRVWGIETQKRLTAARVLIINCTGLASEVAKNVVLAGVGSVTLVDETPCASNTSQNFLVTPDAPPDTSVAEQSAATLQEMNPLVQVKSLPGTVTTITPDVLDDYDQVLLTNCTLTTLSKFDEWCTEKNKKFFAAASRGTTSYFFVNLHRHEYLPADKGGVKATAKVTSEFGPFSKALTTCWSKLRPKRTHKLLYLLRALMDFEYQAGREATMADMDTVKSLAVEICKAEDVNPDVISGSLLEQYLAGTSEFAAINAVTGGVLANEVVKAVSEKGEPLNNFFFFCLEDGVGTVQQLG